MRNLFDRGYIASAFLNPDIIGGEPVAFDPGLPRQFILAFSVQRLAE